MKHLLFCASALVISTSLIPLSSCTKEKQPDETVDIVPIYKEVFNFPSLSHDERQACLDSFMPVFKGYSYIFKEDLTTDGALMDFATRPLHGAFVPVVDDILTEERLDSVEEIAAKSFKLMKAELPGVKTPKLYGIVTPYIKKIYVVDSIMMISLNHYLGEDFDGYSSWPEYRREVARLSLMPYNIVEAWIGSQYPFKALGRDQVLSHMLYSGVMTYAKLKLVPDANEHDALSYNEARWKWLEDNEKMIWDRMINQEIPFSTDQTLVADLTKHRPGSPMIHPDAPGHIGNYIGYKIVKSYLKNNPQTKLVDMLKPEFYNDPKFLQKSGYQGSK